MFWNGILPEAQLANLIGGGGVLDTFGVIAGKYCFIDFGGIS